MTITELFNKLQKEKQLNDLCGELTLRKKTIVWTYTSDSNYDLNEIDEDNDDFGFSSISSEEQLFEAYRDDLGKIQMILDEYDEIDNYNYSEPDINKNIISFKIS